MGDGEQKRKIKVKKRAGSTKNNKEINTQNGGKNQVTIN